MDLTTSDQGAAGLEPVQNLPQDLSLLISDVEPKMKLHNQQNDDNNDLQANAGTSHDFTGPSTHTYHLNNYKYKVETLSNHLINVANVTV